MKKTFLILIALLAGLFQAAGQPKSLHQLQQEFVDLRFGMFVHFGLPTFQEADWTDPQLSPEVFNPVRLNTDQWVQVAKSAGAHHREQSRHRQALRLVVERRHDDHGLCE